MVKQINVAQGDQAKQGKELAGRMQDVTRQVEAHEAQLTGLVEAMDAGRGERRP